MVPEGKSCSEPPRPIPKMPASAATSAASSNQRIPFSGPLSRPRSRIKPNRDSGCDHDSSDASRSPARMASARGCSLRPCPLEIARAEMQLRVPHALRGEVLRNFRSNEPKVLVFADKPHHPNPGGDELCKVAIVELSLEGLETGYFAATAVFLDKAAGAFVAAWLLRDAGATLFWAGLAGPFVSPLRPIAYGSCRLSGLSVPRRHHVATSTTVRYSNCSWGS